MKTLHFSIEPDMTVMLKRMGFKQSVMMENLDLQALCVPIRLTCRETRVNRCFRPEQVLVSLPIICA